MVHVGFSVLFLIIILVFKEINQRTLIDAVLTAAGYTYGPLLGLFFFGLLTKRIVIDKLVPVVCVLAPVLSYIISANSVEWMDGYRFSYELYGVNGLLTMLGLWMISKKAPGDAKAL